MARYLGLWYGGSSYASPGPDDGEDIDSLRQAGRILQSRADNDDGRTPCVDEDRCEFHLYRGGTYHDNGPDLVLTIGPRGGIRRE